MIIDQPPKVARTPEVDAKSMRELFPGRIHVSIAGFGQSGPRADLTSCDLIGEGYSGNMDVTGRRRLAAR